MSIQQDLLDGMEEVKSLSGREVVETWRTAIIVELEEAEQGASGLVDYVEPIQEEGDKFVIRISHPTAKLHERGGHIEPEYAQAMAMGWTRDGFYEALQDCEEWVTRKHYMRDAAYTVRRQFQ